jgi:putative acetyltransferase
MSLSSFSLRPATNADCSEVQALIFSVLEEYGLKPDPADTDLDLYDLEAAYRQRGGYFGVVEINGIIVATLGLLKLDAHACELRKMYTLPTVRGQGLGRFLLDTGIQQARAWVCKRMVLETASVLKEAIALYRRYGFTEYFPPHITCRCDMAMELILINE